jgi:adenine-specific DNA methylase
MPLRISIQLKCVILKCDRCCTWRINGLKKKNYLAQKAITISWQFIKSNDERNKKTVWKRENIRINRKKNLMRAADFHKWVHEICV